MRADKPDDAPPMGYRYMFQKTVKVFILECYLCINILMKQSKVEDVKYPTSYFFQDIGSTFQRYCKTNISHEH